METLGQDFKRRREERNVSLREVAETTRVGVRFLQAIEADDFTALPGGVYTRSFIRTYAKYLGMDEDEIVARYQKQVVTEEPTEPMMSYKDYPAESSQVSLWVGLLVLLGLIGGGTYGVLHYLEQKNNQNAINANKNTPNLASPNPTASPVNPTPQPTEGTPTPNPTATPSVALNTPTPTATPLLQQVVLTLKTKGDAWVSIRTDEETNSQMLTIPANTSRDFKATSKMKVTIGNLPAVQVQINGQAAKLPSTNGLVVNGALITSENYQEYIAAANSQTLPTPAPNTKRLGSPSPNTTPKPNLGAAGVAKPNPSLTPKPTLNADGTVAKPKKPILNADGTVAKPKKPILNADGTVAKPKPTLNADGTVAKPKKPILNADGTVAKPKPTLNADGTVAKPKKPVLNADGTVAKPKLSTPKPNSTATPKPKLTTPKPANTAAPKQN